MSKVMAVLLAGGTVLLMSAQATAVTTKIVNWTYQGQPQMGTAPHGSGTMDVGVYSGTIFTMTGMLTTSDGVSHTIGRVVSPTAWNPPGGVDDRYPLDSKGTGLTLAGGLGDTLKFYHPISETGATGAYDLLISGVHSGNIGTFTGTPSAPALKSTGTASTSSAVPEPSSWALMLLGFGALGFALRRQSTLQGVQV